MTTRLFTKLALAAALMGVPLVAAGQPEKPDPKSQPAPAPAPPAPPPPAPPPPAPAPPAPPPTDPQPPTDKPTPAQPPSPLPDLDELLGLRPGAGAAGQNPPTDPLDPSRKDLDRLLSGAEVGDAFKQAATLMGDAAERLVKARDTGIVTQRVQQDVVRRLDQLISSLENMAQQAASSSSQSQGEQSRPVPNQQARRQQAGQGENQGETEPPALQEGPLRPGMEVIRSAWGQLPERIRDLLVQGTSDRFSSRWSDLTKAYYRKLAEENSK